MYLSVESADISEMTIAHGMERKKITLQESAFAIR